jgi:hypothetical protein
MGSWGWYQVFHPSVVVAPFSRFRHTFRTSFIVAGGLTALVLCIPLAGDRSTPELAQLHLQPASLLTEPLCTTHTLQHRRRRLLEDLAVRPLVALAVDVNRLVPRPLVLDERLVLGLRGVELGELVGLPVRGDVEGGEGLLAAHHEGTADEAVVARAVDGGRAEEVLARGFEAGEETT